MRGLWLQTHQIFFRRGKTRSMTLRLPLQQREFSLCVSVVIWKRMPRANVGADLFEHREEFRRSPDPGERNDRLAGKTLRLSRSRHYTGHENRLTRSCCDLGDLVSALSRPDNHNGIDMPQLRRDRRAQRPGRKAKPVADADLAVDHGNRQIGLDLPALQAIVEHEHVWIDRAARKPGRLDAIGADDHRRRAREQ
jgi:hypothetical protein